MEAVYLVSRTLAILLLVVAACGRLAPGSEPFPSPLPAEMRRLPPTGAVPLSPLRDAEGAANLGGVALAAAVSEAGGFTPEQQLELDRRFAELNREASAPSGLQFGYDNGFFLASPPEIELDSSAPTFLIRINGRFQLRHSYFDSQGPTLDQNDFELERAFLIFTGFAYTPDLEYHIKFDADSDESEGVDLLDGFITYDVGHALGARDRGVLRLRAGKWKMPFHRARQDAMHQLELADRSMASEFFDINRSVGMGLVGQRELLGKTVNWETTIFNGFQTQRFTPARTGELDRNPAVAARLSADLVGEWGNDGEPDLSWHETPALRVGTAGAFSRLDRDDAFDVERSEFLVPRVVDSGSTLASRLPPNVNELDVSLCSLDANYKCRGLAVHSEYYFRSISDTSGTVPDLFDHGFLLQAGYFVIRKKLEVVTRWSRVDGNSGTLGGDQQSADEIAAGGTWYIRGHDFKVVFDATNLNGAPINSSATNIRPGDDGWLFRSQLLVLF